MPTAHIAIDLGASSGRVIVGKLDATGGELSLDEVHRFEHLPCPTPSGPIWDLTGIWLNILQGIRSAVEVCQQQRTEIKSVGVDTWGVDWALLGGSGELLALPHCYRDPVNEVASQRVVERLGGFEKLYAHTGIQLLPFNTLFQVAARHEQEPRLFDAARHLVFLPDLFHFWLTGELSVERTIASTSSMLDVRSSDWDTGLLEQLDLPTHLLGPISDPGTILGPVRAEICQSTGIPTRTRVVLPAAHDTASAVAAVPAVSDSSWAYLSSGTWSLLGAELNQPIVSERARQVPFTNELGTNGTVRFLKNIAGLWLLQELRRDLQQSGKEHTFSELVDAARPEESGRTLVDPNCAEFAAPGNLQAKLRQFAKNSNQPEPESVGQMARCCLESLALCYAQTLGQLESVIERPIDVLHLVGGGIKNNLLNQLTANAIGRPIVTGPIEATAIGNLLVQAMGCGEIGGLAELRQVVANSFPMETIEPTSDSFPDAMREQYAELVSD